MAVVRRGLRDGTWNRHVALAAYGEAYAGRYDVARRTLALASPQADSTTPDRVDVVRELARSLCEVGESPSGPPARGRFRAARGRIHGLAMQATDATRVDRRDYAPR